MILFKAFYFFFISAWTAMEMYFPVYLKQLGLSASYTGVLVGLAPFQRGIGAFVFGYLADKTNTRKLVLLVSLAANALTPTLYLIPQPSGGECNRHPTNSSQSHGSVFNGTEFKHGSQKTFDLVNRKHISDNISSETRIRGTINRVTGNMSELQDTDMDNEVYNIFSVLLAMIIVGEFLCGPARSLADAAVLQNLESDSSSYGAIRSWGSVGQFPIFLIVSVLVVLVPPISCNSPVPDNYAVALFVFSCYKLFAFACFLPIRFEPQRAISTNNNPHATSKPEQWRLVCQVLLTFQNFTLIIIVCYLGFINGLFYSFMFWFIADVSPSEATWVMGVACTLRAIVAYISYALTGRVFKAIGVINAIHCSLVIYTVALVTYGLLQNPWLAIIPEVIQAVAYALSISAGVVHFGEVGHVSVAATMQGVVQFCYNGVAYGVGGMVTGSIIDRFGGSWTFLFFGGVTGIMTLFSIFTQMIAKHLAQPTDESKYTALPSN